MDDIAGYRHVLHAWASRKLEHYGHIGPFEITDVRVDHEHGYGSPDTPADDDVVVVIRFRHPGGCPDWSRPDWPCQPENVWGMPNTWSFTSILSPVRAAGATALLVLAIAMMWTQTVNPFLYFQF